MAELLAALLVPLCWACAGCQWQRCQHLALPQAACACRPHALHPGQQRRRCCVLWLRLWGAPVAALAAEQLLLQPLAAWQLTPVI
jgi:hypothetical protein